MQNIKYNAEYASEVMTTLPYGYINKNICGVGASSLMLENEENVILVVPSVSLITNKIVQYPNTRCKYNILGIYSGVTDESIKEYLKNNSVIKVMVTYDSLYKVQDYISKYKCRLVIDESNKLLSSSSLKSSSKGHKNIDVVTEVFNIAEKHKGTVTFISATPTPLEYLPKWVSTIPHINMEWENTTKAKPILMQRRYPYKSIIEEVIAPLNETNSITVGNATFSKVIVFMNSVKSILTVCNEAQLKIKDVGVIVGSSLANDIKLKKYKRLEDPTNLPKYTFVTSAGFEGIDLVDSNAISIVVSNTAKKYQMIDIMTDLKQAVSRQRDKNNPNYDKYIYIYNQTIFDKSEEELLEELDSQYSDLEDAIQMWENAKRDDIKKGFKYTAANETFKAYTNYNEKTEVYTINENLFKADKYFILVTCSQYRKGFDIKANYDESVEIKPVVVDTVSYSDMVNIYNKKKNIKDLDQYKHKVEYYTIILETLRLYNKTWKNYSYATKMINSNVKDFDKLKLTIKTSFVLNRTYTSKEIKTILQKIYTQFGISKSPKTVDLNEFAQLKIIKNKPTGTQLISYYK